MRYYHPPDPRLQAEPPAPIEGTLASVDGAANLSGLSIVEVLQGVLDGTIRKAKTSDELLVSLDDAYRRARDLGREGAPR
jgi:hypothetical protein